MCASKEGSLKDICAKNLQSISCELMDKSGHPGQRWQLIRLFREATIDVSIENAMPSLENLKFNFPLLLRFYSCLVSLERFMKSFQAE